ncbi:MAG TPA: hypothetical protein VEK75_04790 [Xanthobacteraceae bacterium]|nr:hypothetical protein [Xanthobacteraceae bacterium]
MTKPGKAAKWAARSVRLSAALRENLKKRKQQAKARVKARTGDRETNETAGADSALPAQGSDFRRNQGAN